MGIKLRALAIVGAVGVIGAAVAGGNDDPASVVRVIDGDTFVASVHGDEKKVRLLNVDTPELGRNGQASECLAESARDYLAEVLTPGTEVELHYDEEQHDRYGRELAGVVLNDSLINVDIAREGFGVAVKYEPNDKYYYDVLSAEREAKSSARGIHESDLACAMSTQVESATTEASTVAAGAMTAISLSALESHLADISIELKKLRHLLDLVSSPSDFAKAAHSGYENERRELDRGIEKLERQRDRVQEKIEQKKESELKREEREQRELAAEQEREQQREQAELQEQLSGSVDHAAPTPRQQPRTASPAPAPAPQPAAPPDLPAASGYDGYTGCRAYGGNYGLTAVDEKGRPYAKIDCTSKVQIG